MNSEIKNIVFDLGGVLVDWNPRALFAKVFADPADMESFLSNVATQDWNEKQDAGRPFAEAVRELCAAHPQYAGHIRAFDERWEEMIRGPIPGTVEILTELHALSARRLFALSNWSAEKFPVAEKLFPFLKLFEGMVVSGRVGIKKPDPRIFIYLCDEYSIVPGESVFIDDVLGNIEAAKRLGFATVQFESPEQLRRELVSMGLL